MNQNQAAITILTPTMNRSAFIHRALRYYSQVRFGGTILIGDSSNEQERRAVESAIAAHSGKLRIEFHSFPNPPFINDALCLREMIERASTPYLVYAGDDDLLVPRTLAQCVDFLETHSDFSAAHGVYIAFKLKHVGATGAMAETHHAPNHVLLSDSARDRWVGYMQYALSTQYYVHRKETWQLMYADLPNVPLRYLGTEVLPCSMSAISGKIIEIDALSTLFQINPERLFGWTTHSMYTMTLDPNWANSVRGLRSAIAREIAKRDNLAVEEAENFFDGEWWRHMLVMLQAHYDSRGYEPNNPFVAFKRRYPAVVKAWNAARRIRAGRYRNCSLKKLLQTSHVYHADFKAAYDVITDETHHVS
jgi:glycosyltransferase domain-containing protein